MGSENPANALWTTQSVLSTLPHPPEENSASPVPFFHLLERLKTTKREGWRRFGITSGESISDHMYRMSVMTMLAPPTLAARLNLSHCMKMALIHDMAESLVGDITPVDPVSKVEKARREADVMDYIAKNLLGGVPGGMLTGQEILNVFQEYEENKTLEAQFVHDIDKMELLLQMVEYERANSVDLSEFCHVARRVQLPEIKEWAATVLQEREAFWKKKTEEKEANA
ncbi:HD domain-containing protein [Aspergillus floccosus]